MRIRKTLLAASLGVGLFSAASANAALTLTLGGQGVYDTDLNITWLRDANLAVSNTFGVGGINPAGTPGIFAPIDIGGTMKWNTAQSWLAAMNANNYLGFSDWRLPTTSGGCNGFNCTGSEMGHLFYNELGGTAGSSILSSSDPDLALFQNVQPYIYWSTPSPYANLAWYFDMRSGFQYDANKEHHFMFVWAVRDGNSQVSAVSEPETYAMLLAGLGLLGSTARRKKTVPRNAGSCSA
ncbi:MAG: hypothetical protein FD134_594 [Gallionellaceae bacterium]|nr:MAG: hypothetical protein FD134_594 [Gallionellaceae bacterium]